MLMKFLLIFHSPWLTLFSTPDLTFYEQLEIVSRKAEDANPTDAPGPCSQFLLDSELLNYFCDFVCITLVMFFVVCVCSISCLCHWITFFWLLLESWFPWFLFLLVDLLMEFKHIIDQYPSFTTISTYRL